MEICNLNSWRERTARERQKHVYSLFLSLSVFLSIYLFSPLSLFLSSIYLYRTLFNTSCKYRLALIAFALMSLNQLDEVNFANVMN
jgi:hypothetical protein